MSRDLQDLKKRTVQEPVGGGTGGAGGPDPRDEYKHHARTYKCIVSRSQKEVFPESARVPRTWPGLAASLTSNDA